MGLDMYLTARRSFYTFRGDTHPVDPQVPSDYPIEAVTVQAAYWRKANAIHAWFVRETQGGVDECQSTDVSGLQLKMLRDLCVELLASRDSAAAMEKLPPQSGFFFGGTDVDDGYWIDLQDTVDQIDKALAALPTYFEGADNSEAVWDYTYQSSW